MANDFLPFGISESANVVTQAEYAGLASRSTGFTAGTAVSKQLNKAWRQSSVMSHVLAEFIEQNSGNDVLDDGDIPTIQNNLTLAVQAAIADGIPYATQLEAEAGTALDKVMSPLRVFQAIAKVVVQATETAFGWLKIATLSQTNTGTDDSTAITPKKLAAATQTQTLSAGTTTGTATAYVISGIPGLASYVTKLRLNVTFHVDSGANPTVNVNAIGAKNLKQYDSTGAKVAVAVKAGQIGDIVYDGTDMVLLDPLPTNTVVRQGVRGDCSNYRAIANGISGNIVVTADRVVVEDSTNDIVALYNISLTLNTLAAASATVDGMATGATVANGLYALYVWYNKSTGAIRITGDTSFTAPTSPATGFNHWARRGSFKVDSTVNRYPLSSSQANNKFKYEVVAGSNVTSFPGVISGLYNTATTQPLTSYCPSTASSAYLVAGSNAGYIGFAPVGAFSTTPGSQYLSLSQPNGFPFVGGWNASGPVPTTSGEVSLMKANAVQYCCTAAGGILQLVGFEDSL
jgi:hypothetical protein